MARSRYVVARLGNMRRPNAFEVFRSVGGTYLFTGADAEGYFDPLTHKGILTIYGEAQSALTFPEDFVMECQERRLLPSDMGCEL